EPLVARRARGRALREEALEPPRSRRRRIELEPPAEIEGKDANVRDASGEEALQDAEPFAAREAAQAAALEPEPAVCVHGGQAGFREGPPVDGDRGRAARPALGGQAIQV